jgi:hypothetical protein
MEWRGLGRHPEIAGGTAGSHRSSRRRDDVGATLAIAFDFGFCDITDPDPPGVPVPPNRRCHMTIGAILRIVLALLLIGAIPT